MTRGSLAARLANLRRSGALCKLCGRCAVRSRGRMVGLAAAAGIGVLYARGVEAWVVGAVQATPGWPLQVGEFGGFGLRGWLAGEEAEAGFQVEGEVGGAAEAADGGGGQMAAVGEDCFQVVEDCA